MRSHSVYCLAQVERLPFQRQEVERGACQTDCEEKRCDKKTFLYAWASLSG